MDWELVGIDVTNESFGLYKGLKPHIVPKYSDKNCFDVIEKIIEQEKIDLVFCTVNEGLLEWSKRKKYFKGKYNADIVISDEQVIEICVDKWRTYKFFNENKIRLPNSKDDFPLLAQNWRGSGIYYNTVLPKILMVKDIYRRK